MSPCGCRTTSGIHGTAAAIALPLRLPHPRRVSRYFFHLNKPSRLNDEEGLELADAVTARREAVAFAGAMLRDDPEMVWDGQELRVQVERDDGRHICTVVILAVNGPVLDDIEQLEHSQQRSVE